MITTLKIIYALSLMAIFCVLFAFVLVVFAIKEGVMWVKNTLTNCLKYAMGSNKRG